VAVLAGWLMQSPASAASKCSVPAGARVLAQDSFAIVWRTSRRIPSTSAHKFVWTACVRSSGRKTVIARGDDFADTATTLVVALAGRYLAYGKTVKGGLGASTSTVYVRDLRRSKVVFRHAGTAPDPNSIGLEYISQVAVAADGGLGWIGETIESAGPVAQVWKHDRCATALLDRSAAIKPRSLRLRRHVLSWHDGAVVKTATLCH
jgi:hypothetical protein